MKTAGWTFKTLASAYSPDIAPASAARRLRLWIDRVPALHDRLASMGWHQGCRALTPRMVQAVVEGLGEP